MNEWKTYTLKDLSKDKGEYGIGAPSIPFDKDKLTYLRITDINDDGTLNKSGLTSVDAMDASKYLLEKNDIVFARTGNSTGRSYFYDGNEGPLVYAGFLIRFRLDDSKVNPRILKYYTHSKPYYDWVQSFDTGGTRGNINAKTYGDMPITLPPRHVQDRIVDILYSIDAKIENNRRINDNLEQQAQALFNYYFVDNINELGDYHEGSLTDVASYLNGLAMQKFRPEGTDCGLPVLKIKELGQGFCDSSSDRCSSYIKDDYVINNGEIIFSWSGTLLVDFWCAGKCGLNQHLFKVTSDDYPKWFIYFWTKHHLDQFIRIAKDKAVTMGHIKRSELDNANVLIPSTEKLDQIGATIAPMIDKLINNRVEMMELSSLRDSLLPKLMSGELKINEIDC